MVRENMSEAFLFSLPEGFIPATENINKLSAGDLEHLANETCELLYQRKGYPTENRISPSRNVIPNKSDNLIPIDENHGVRTTVQADQAARNVLCVIFRDAFRSKCDPEEFGSAILSASNISSSLCDVLKRVWAQYYTALQSSVNVKVNKVLSIGKLSGFEWKFGVSTESSQSSKLNSPFVLLIFRITDTNGMVNSHVVEMSIADFNQFSESLSSMSAVLDTL